MQVERDPAALPKLAALFQKMRSVMQPALAQLASHPDEDTDFEVVHHYSSVLLHRVEKALKVMQLQNLVQCSM